MLWITLGLAAFFAFNLYLSNRVLQLSRYTVPSARLPAAFDGFKVVQLSDWHDAMFGTDNREIVDMVRGEEPDIIVLTGDFVEKQTEFSDMEILCRALVEIAPTYFVAGNHEWGGRVMRLLSPRLREWGVTYLSNDYEFITRNGQSICLLGIEDLNGPRDQLKLPEVVAQARRDGDPYILMLCHRYDRWQEFVRERVDLALTGHAHGGMVRLPFTDGLYGPGREFLPQHTSGVTREGETAMVTSRGIGTAKHVPARLFNRPEIVSITLKTAK